jgi:hypothetical protein
VAAKCYTIRLCAALRGLGENDKAIESLWQDYEARATPFLLWLKVFPVFDPLHSEPRFIKLLRRIGVEPD